ncbi:MAG: hypothetical protein LQ350_004072 [Teloschistes chrysophthalmus]|nr:MAG: hypothetical protein LQ350_004072 [Niorma chrysophthalma]
MAQVNQNPAVGASAGRTASLDYAVPSQSGPAMSTAHKVPSATANQSDQPRASYTEPRASYTEPRASYTEPRGSITEERLEKAGRMPNLPEANAVAEENIRPPGTEDAGGNKIHRRGFLKKLLHWEHNGMNAD